MYAVGQTTSLLPLLASPFLDLAAAFFSMDATSSQGLVLLLFLKFGFLLIAYFFDHYFTMENMEYYEILWKVLSMRFRKPYNEIFIDTNKIRIARNNKS